MFKQAPSGFATQACLSEFWHFGHSGGIQLSMCTLSDNLNWACAYFQPSMCTLSVEHAHTPSWSCTRFQLSIHTLSGIVEHLHTYTWACTSFQLSMCTHPVEHVHTFSWACGCLHVHTTSWACALSLLGGCHLELVTNCLWCLPLLHACTIELHCYIIIVGVNICS